jgi:hypothetical protein
MGNNLKGGFAEVWAKEYQTVFHQENVAKVLSAMSYKESLIQGDTYTRVKKSTDVDNPSLDSYVRGADIDIQDITDTKEQLVIDKSYSKGFYVDDFDALQSNYEIAIEYGNDNAMLLSNQLDKDVLGLSLKSTNVVDAKTLNSLSTAGDGIPLTTTNFVSMVTHAKRLLMKNNIPTNNLVAIVSPEVEQVMTEYMINRDTMLGDKVATNGFVGKFNQFDFHMSNSLPDVKILGFGIQATNNDTITINGVVFRTNTALGGAGSVLLGADVAACRTNLASAINGTTGAGTTYTALSKDDRRKLLNVKATVVGATVVVTGVGVGVLQVSETLTNAGNIWSKGSQSVIFARKGATHCMVQSAPKFVVKEVPNRFGKNILTGTLYGCEAYADGLRAMVTAKIDSLAF